MVATKNLSGRPLRRPGGFRRCLYCLWLRWGASWLKRRSDRRGFLAGCFHHLWVGINRHRVRIYENKHPINIFSTVNIGVEQIIGWCSTWPRWNSCPSRIVSMSVLGSDLKAIFGVEKLNCLLRWHGDTAIRCDFALNLGGGFKYFLFSPLPGEMIQFD